MNPVEVAKYLRCFQRAVRTGRVHSRLIRRDGRYDASIAELIRAVLPRTMYQMPRRHHGYELVWQGSQEALDRLRVRLPQRLVILRRVVRLHQRHFLQPPFEALLDEAVEALPILTHFHQDEAVGMQAPPPPPERDPEDAPEGLDNRRRAEAMREVEEMMDELDEREEPEPIPVTHVVPPAEITAAIAEAARTRADRVPTNVEFPTEGARRFAEAVARATRGGQ
jgi:hypothetical protein